MKKAILRFLTFLVLLTGSFLIYEDSAAGAPPSCWQTTFNRWSNCDNNYSATLTAHYFAPQTCGTTAHNSCSHLQGSAYTDCYSSTYSGCINQDNQTYSDRGTSYGSCMGIEGNGNNCVEQLEGCGPAHDRAAACNNLYSTSEDEDALSECMNKSGVWQCM